QSDSKIVAVGQAGGSSSAFALARFNLNGTLDPSFGTGGQVTTKIGPSQNGAATGVVTQPDGKIVVVGSAGPGGSQEFAVARYNPSGSLDATFGSGGIVLTSMTGNASAT